MPFGMGPWGWLIWPYWAQWLGYWYPWSLYGAPYYGYPYYGYTGYGAPYATPMTKEQETTMLQDQAKALQQELDRINARLKELQKGK